MSLITPEEVIGVRRLGAVGATHCLTESKAARIALGEGLMVVQDAASDHDCDLPAGAAEVVLGMSVYRAAKEEGTSAFYDATEQVTILKKGKGFALCETACTKGGQVFVRHTGGNEGQVRNDADGGNATALPGARFDETGVAGPVLIDLNLPAT